MSDAVTVVVGGERGVGRGLIEAFSASGRRAGSIGADEVDLTDPVAVHSALEAAAATIRAGDLDDTFALADLLAHDREEVVQAAVGGFVREAGKRDPERLRSYLDRHVPGLPKTILRHATRHLPQSERRRYRDLTTSA